MPARTIVYYPMLQPFFRKPLPPLRIAWLGFFCFASAVIAALAGVSLIFPGTILDHMWRLNSTAYAQFSAIGKPAGILLLLLSPALVVTGAGILSRRRWSYYASLAALVANILGDLVNVIRGETLKGFAGIFLAGLLFLYLLSHPIKDYFLSQQKERFAGNDRLRNEIDSTVHDETNSNGRTKS